MNKEPTMSRNHRLFFFMLVAMSIAVLGFEVWYAMRFGVNLNRHLPFVYPAAFGALVCLVGKWLTLEKKLGL